MACFLAAALIGALGQYLYKSASDAAGEDLSRLLTNWRLLAGVACYVAVMGLFVAGFRIGGSMRVLYPLYASTFIWGALISRVAFRTPVTGVHIAGMLLLVGGMCLMGWE